MATHDALKDWQALGQQYWQGLADLGQQVWQQHPGAAAAKPWAEGLEQWRQWLPQGDVGAVLEQTLAQGKTWLGALESAFRSAGAGQSLDVASLARRSLEQLQQSQPWLQGLGGQSGWFDPAQIERWLGGLGLSTEKPLPAFGLTREHQERAQQLLRDLADYQRETTRYQALIQRALESAISRLEGKLAERAEPGRQLDSLKAVYDLWIDALEDSYAEVALSPEFRTVYGALVNAQMRVRQGIGAQVEKLSSELGMPTRSELDGVHHKVAELKRAQRRQRDDHERLQRLEDELVSLRGELQALRAAHASQAAAASRATPAAPAPTAAAAVAVAKPATPKPAPPKPAPARKARIAPPQTTTAAPEPAAPAAKSTRPRKR